MSAPADGEGSDRYGGRLVPVDEDADAEKQREFSSMTSAFRIQRGGPVSSSRRPLPPDHRSRDSTYREDVEATLRVSGAGQPSIPPSSSSFGETAIIANVPPAVRSEGMGLRGLVTVLAFGVGCRQTKRNLPEIVCGAVPSGDLSSPMDCALAMCLAAQTSAMLGAENLARRLSGGVLALLESMSLSDKISGVPECDKPKVAAASFAFNMTSRLLVAPQWQSSAAHLITLGGGSTSNNYSWSMKMMDQDGYRAVRDESDGGAARDAAALTASLRDSNLSKSAEEIDKALRLLATTSGPMHPGTADSGPCEESVRAASSHARRASTMLLVVVIGILSQAGSPFARLMSLAAIAPDGLLDRRTWVGSSVPQVRPPIIPNTGAVATVLRVIDQADPLIHSDVLECRAMLAALFAAKAILLHHTSDLGRATKVAADALALHDSLVRREVAVFPLCVTNVLALGLMFVNLDIGPLAVLAAAILKSGFSGVPLSVVAHEFLEHYLRARAMLGAHGAITRGAETIGDLARRVEELRSVVSAVAPAADGAEPPRSGYDALIAGDLRRDLEDDLRVAEGALTAWDLTRYHAKILSEVDARFKVQLKILTRTRDVAVLSSTEAVRGIYSSVTELIAKLHTLRLRVSELGAWFRAGSISEDEARLEIARLSVQEEQLVRTLAALEQSAENIVWHATSIINSHTRR